MDDSARCQARCVQRRLVARRAATDPQHLPGRGVPHPGVRQRVAGDRCLGARQPEGPGRCAPELLCRRRRSGAAGERSAGLAASGAESCCRVLVLPRRPRHRSLHPAVHPAPGRATRCQGQGPPHASGAAARAPHVAADRAEVPGPERRDSNRRCQHHALARSHEARPAHAREGPRPAASHRRRRARRQEPARGRRARRRAGQARPVRLEQQREPAGRRRPRGGCVQRAHRCARPVVVRVGASRHCRRPAGVRAMAVQCQRLQSEAQPRRRAHRDDQEPPGVGLAGRVGALRTEAGERPCVRPRREGPRGRSTRAAAGHLDADHRARRSPGCQRACAHDHGAAHRTAVDGAARAECASPGALCVPVAGRAHRAAVGEHAASQRDRAARRLETCGGRAACRGERTPSNAGADGGRGARYRRTTRR
ncbi:hypothetical protein D3C87_1003790 [compost metagenome]